MFPVPPTSPVLPDLLFGGAASYWANVGGGTAFVGAAELRL